MAESNRLDTVMDVAMTSHTERMARISENGESASNIVRHAGARHLNETDAIESKGAAQVLSLPPAKQS